MFAKCSGKVGWYALLVGGGLFFHLMLLSRVHNDVIVSLQLLAPTPQHEPSVDFETANVDDDDVFSVAIFQLKKASTCQAPASP